MQGRTVTIEPLRPEHARELWPGADDDAIRRWWPRRWRSEADVAAQIDALLAQRDTGTAEPFLLRDAGSGEAAGSTAYYNISRPHRHLSIGWTFLLAPWRRTGLNTETKRLLLAEAFDGRGMERVQFDVDGRNDRSQAAVARIGATREGTLRRHKVLHDGYIRDTVVFSILREEWPAVDARLADLQARHVTAVGS